MLSIGVAHTVTVQCIDHCNDDDLLGSQHASVGGFVTSASLKKCVIHFVSLESAQTTLM